MNQLGLDYIYTWKYHKETPCVALYLKQSKMSFFPFFLFFLFLPQNQRTGGKNKSLGRRGEIPVGGGR
jgi:hypothetical protein